MQSFKRLSFLFLLFLLGFIIAPIISGIIYGADLSSGHPAFPAFLIYIWPSAIVVFITMAIIFSIEKLVDLKHEYLYSSLTWLFLLLLVAHPKALYLFYGKWTEYLDFLPNTLSIF